MSTDEYLNECVKDCPKCNACAQAARAGISRRQFLRMASGCLALGGLGAALAACAPVATEPPTAPTAESRPGSQVLPTENGSWTPPEPHVGDMPADTGAVVIRNVGQFTFDADQVETHRPDVFQAGHFSLFDVLAHLAERGEITVDYHFDEDMDTHVIDTINGQRGWWYQAHYSAGWYESNAFRMDMYPYKNDTQFRLFVEHEQRLADVYRTFREEVARLARNGGQVILPTLEIQAPGWNQVFQDVEVTAYDVRNDVLQPGVVTALDALLSLAEQGRLSGLGLTWYERIAAADPVDSYWVEQIDDARASGGCGFVYETGPRDFRGFSGSHIHIPSDVRATVSPEYALWFWICL